MRKVLVVLVALLVTSHAARAFINPNFTPVDLVKQSDTILLLEFAKADAKGMASATVDERDLGTWSVRAGGPGAFIGLEESGPLVLHWCLPGAELQKKEIVVEGKPVRFVLDRK